jgi:hypothetical protein
MRMRMCVYTSGKGERAGEEQRSTKVYLETSVVSASCSVVNFKLGLR